jgi:7 transmembrane receptor (rhodopsin family)
MLRGRMSGERCWFILLNSEFILAITIIGIVPVCLVLVLYSFILYQALKKVSELKKATSDPKGTETANKLRYYRGSTATLSQLQEQESSIPLRQQSNDNSPWLKSKSKSNETALAASPVSNREPSKWKAIKVVLFTTGAFVFTWVPYFVASTMFVYCDQENNPNFCKSLKVAIASPLAILGFTNSLLNPIIYAWWHNGFRTNSLQIFSKRFQKTNCCRRCFNKSDGNVASPRTANSSSATNLSSSSPTASSAAASTEINSKNVMIVSTDGTS